MDNENINIDDDELEIREEEETEEDIEAVIEDDDEDESEDAELDEDGDGADDANEDPAEDGAALTEEPRQQTDAGNEKKTDEAEIERLKRELAEKEKIIEQKNKALRFVGYDENNSEALASGFDGTQQEKGDAARAAEFAREKRQADYDLVVMKYPWAANEAKSVDGFGEKFMRVMQYNEDKMTALDAFEISHAQEINEHRHKQTVSADIRAAERRAVRNMSNKEQGVGKSGGGNAVTIPKAVYEQYRAFNPDVTDKEIARHYQRDKKK